MTKLYFSDSGDSVICRVSRFMAGGRQIIIRRYQDVTMDKHVAMIEDVELSIEQWRTINALIDPSPEPLSRS